MKAKRFYPHVSLLSANVGVTKAGAPPLDDVRIIQRGNYTFAEVYTAGYALAGYGFAKRNPDDEVAPNLGRKIAFSRAVSDYLKAYKNKRPGGSK